LASKRLSKRDIKEDTFITNMLKGWEYVREHQGYVFAGLIAVVIIVAGINWYVNSREQSRIGAMSQFSEGLTAYRNGDLETAEAIFRNVGDQYGNLREGVYAQYFLGECALADGRNFAAIEKYDAYLAKSGSHPFYRDAARDGKGVALENERRHKEAADVYYELSNDIETNTFMETVYLRRAAENYKKSNEIDKVIEIMERLLDLTTGTERRDIEVELAILRG